MVISSIFEQYSTNSILSRYKNSVLLGFKKLHGTWSTIHGQFLYLFPLFVVWTNIWWKYTTETVKKVLFLRFLTLWHIAYVFQVKVLKKQAIRAGLQGNLTLRPTLFLAVRKSIVGQCFVPAFWMIYGVTLSSLSSAKEIYRMQIMMKKFPCKSY